MKFNKGTINWYKVLNYGYNWRPISNNHQKQQKLKKKKINIPLVIIYNTP